MARRTHRTTGDSRRAMVAANVNMAEDSITGLTWTHRSEHSKNSFPPRVHVSLPDQPSPVGAPELPASGPACERSSLSPQLRLALTFGVLFALKWTLPVVGLP